MARGYRKGLKMSRTLDYLLRKGVDCIKIIPPEHIADGTILLALGVGEDEHSYGRLCKICNSIIMDGVEISPKRMDGEEIKRIRELRGLEPNPKYKGINLKIEEGRSYNVLEIKYLLAEVGIRTSKKYDMSYLGPKRF